MAGEDAFGFGLDAAGVVDELAAVAVAGEAFDGVDLEVDFDDFAAVAGVAEGELASAFLDAAAKGAFDLVADEDDGIISVAGKLFEVFDAGSAGEHAAGGEDDAGSSFDDFVADLVAVDLGEVFGEEGVLALVEDFVAEFAGEEFGVGGVDGGGFDDHAVDEDGGFLEGAAAHVFVDDDEEFLGAADGEDGDEGFTAAFEGAVDVVDELAFGVFAGGHEVTGCAVGGFHDEGFEAWEAVCGGFEEAAAGVFEVAGEGEIVEAVADVEVGDTGAEDVSGVVESEADVGGDIGNFAIVEGDGVHDEFADVTESIGCDFAFAVGNFEVVDLEHGHEVLGGRCAVDGSLVTVFVQKWGKSAVVKVCVGDYNGIEFSKVEFRKIEAGEGLFGGADVDTTVKHDIGFGGLHEQTHTTHFAEAAKWCYSNVAVAEEGWAVNAASNGSEDGFAIFTRVLDGVSDFENGFGAEGRGSDDGRSPEGFEPDFFHRVAGSTNNESRFFGFDNNFADGFVERDAGYFCFFGDNFSDLFFCNIMWASYLGI